MARQNGKSIRRIGQGDYSYLTQPRGDGTTWYVSISVPRPLRGKFGGRKALVRSLATANIEEARAARWSVIRDLKAEIGRTIDGEAVEASPFRTEAEHWRDYLKGVGDHDEREIALDRIIERAEQISHTSGEDGGVAKDDARAFFDLAIGKATPIRTYVERWLGTTTYTDRTKADARSAIEHLCGWLKETGRPDFIERIDDRTAADFRDEALVARGVHRNTANKKLSALRQYWEWLAKSFGEFRNPWVRKSLKKVQAHRVSQSGPEGRERPFTDDEMRKLLTGSADSDLADLMRIAALTGMRLEEIGQLRIQDCQDNMFTIGAGKTGAAVRVIPIHSVLRRLIKTRTAGRDAKDYLFKSFRGSGWDGNRTMAVSKRFATYRRRVGVDDRREGSRRSKVNFHSFRRWFITKADEAGHPRDLIAAIVGHERGGVTLGVYSQADLRERMRRCVEAVKLPRL